MGSVTWTPVGLKPQIISQIAKQLPNISLLSSISFSHSFPWKFTQKKQSRRALNLKKKKKQQHISLSRSIYKHKIFSSGWESIWRKPFYWLRAEGKIALNIPFTNSILGVSQW